MAVKVIEEHEYEALMERLEKLERKVILLEEAHVQYLTTEQACERLQCSREKLNNLRKAGKIQYRMNGKSYRYLASSIAECYEEIEQAKAGRGKKRPKLAEMPFKKLANG